MNPWIDVIGWTLIHFVWQGGVLTGATVLALWLCRRRSSEARYAVACLSLIAMLASALSTAVRLRASDPLLLTGASVVTGIPGSRPALAQPGNPGNGVSTPASAAHGISTVEAVLPAVVWFWLTGVAALLVRFSGGCWRVHRLRRAALAIERSPWQSASERLRIGSGCVSHFTSWSHRSSMLPPSSAGCVRSSCSPWPSWPAFRRTISKP